MASTPPETTPDSPPPSAPGDIERVDPAYAPRRESIEDPTPGSQPLPPGPDDAGLPGGTGGTGGTNRDQDD